MFRAIISSILRNIYIMYRESKQKVNTDMMYRESKVMVNTDTMSCCAYSCTQYALDLFRTHNLVT